MRVNVHFYSYFQDLTGCAVMVEECEATGVLAHGGATGGPQCGKGAQSCNQGRGVAGGEGEAGVRGLDEGLGFTADAEEYRSLHRHRLENF